jgi:hypothetical protein
MPLKDEARSQRPLMPNVAFCISLIAATLLDKSAAAAAVAAWPDSALRQFSSDALPLAARWGRQIQER